MYMRNQGYCSAEKIIGQSRGLSESHMTNFATLLLLYLSEIFAKIKGIGIW